MSKITLTNIENLENELTSKNAINANNSTIQTAMDNTLSRDGTSPNTMGADIDMNSYHLINLADPSTNQHAVTKAYGDAHYGDSLASANAAAASATSASSSASASATSATSSANSATSSNTSATNAATSATAAATSATNAATSATNAAASAGVIGAQWTFDTSTTMSDPGTGKFRFNNATVASVTAIAVSDTDSETGNPNIKNYILSWDDSTNTVKGYLVLRKLGTPATYAIYSITGSITDNTTWCQISVSYVASNGTWSASDTAVGGFTRAGDQGTNGTTAISGTPTAGHVATFLNSTTIQDGGALATSATTDTTNASNISSGTLAAARGGAGTVSGILKANGSGTVSAATNGTDYLSPGTTGTITVGYGITPYNGGTVTTGTYTPSAANGNYQYYTNNGAHTLAAPAADCAIDILITNGASAGAITFGSYTVASGNTGDPLTTTSTNKFIVSIRRINAVATYIIKALQ